VTNLYSVEFDLYFLRTQSTIQQSRTLQYEIKPNVGNTHTYTLDCSLKLSIQIIRIHMWLQIRFMSFLNTVLAEYSCVQLLHLCRILKVLQKSHNSFSLSHSSAWRLKLASSAFILWHFVHFFFLDLPAGKSHFEACVVIMMATDCGMCFRYYTVQ
jgi:hypothetical protein